jgi:Cu/Ag efflux pump CusA
VAAGFRLCGFFLFGKFAGALAAYLFSDEGVPVLVRHVAEARFGPDLRRGIGELNGVGEAVDGIRFSGASILNSVLLKPKVVQRLEEMESHAERNRNAFESLR